MFAKLLRATHVVVKPAPFRQVRPFSFPREPSNLRSYLAGQRDDTNAQKSIQEKLADYEAELGRPLTAKEKFEREQFEKERTERGEEDHQEDVSFEDKFVYTKMIVFSVLFFGFCYQMHKILKRKQDEVMARRAGTAEVYQDPSKLNESQRMYAEPGGEWTLKDLYGRPFSSFNLRGNYYLLFFGHTLCPDATPLTVANMTKAARKMRNHKESQYIQCKCVFVTVQPEIDTPKHMR